MNTEQKDGWKMANVTILVVAFAIYFVVAGIRITWKQTEINSGNIELKQQIACLEGGGRVAFNDFGTYIRCVQK